MTGYIRDAAFDAALNNIKTNCTHLYICSSQPTTYAEATSTYALGNKASPSITGPADDTSGRKITIDAITDGSVTATGTAGYMALVNSSGSELLVAQALSASQAVTSGNTFSLTAFKVAIPDPTT